MSLTSTTGDRSVPSAVADTRGHDKAPPRRRGRDCGYVGLEELGAARRRIGAALTALARDSDPASRRAGAELAAEATRLLEEVSGRAEAATTPARRALADVERRLPRLQQQLAQAQTRTSGSRSARG